VFRFAVSSVFAVWFSVLAGLAQAAGAGTAGGVQEPASVVFLNPGYSNEPFCVDGARRSVACISRIRGALSAD
jgi:hypothetical protein